MRSIIQWFSRNHVAANFIMLALLVGGVIGWMSEKKEIFPETSIDSILIRTAYPNATPSEVETGVSVPIEEAIADVDGVKRVTSTSAEGFSSVIVEVRDGHNLREVMDDLNTRVQAVDNLAENAERPELEELLIRMEVLSVAISAETDEATLKRMAEDLRDGLLDQPEITQVSIFGARDSEIAIEVSEANLRAHGLTLEQIAQRVRQSSVDLPGGSLRTRSGEILMRTASRKYSVEEFAGIPVLTRPDGTVLTLRAIATIRDDFEEEDVAVRFDGRPALILKVFRVGNEDTLQVAAAVRRHLDEVRAMLPPGVELEVWNDQSSFLRDRLSLLTRNAAIGFSLVCLVLALFMRPSLAFFVAIGIPTSFAGAMMMMPALDVSINMISLFAFIMVLGIVVDDALVTGENVYTRLQAGEHPKLAAWRGTHEVAVVITFGVLTTVVAFTPMLMLSGVSGRIWPNIPLVVIPTLLTSLVLCFLVLPAHLATLRPYRKEDDESRIGRILHAVENAMHRAVDSLYLPLLKVAARHRYLTISLFSSLLFLIVGMVGAGWIKTEFFPQVEADIISCNLTMPRGASFEDTLAAVAAIEAGADRLAEQFRDNEGNPVVVHRLATAGTQPFQTGFVVGTPSGAHLGQVTLELRPAATRDMLAAELAAKWREFTGPIPGAVDVNFQTLAAGGGNAVDLEISSNNLDELHAATTHIKERLATYTGITDITDTNLEGKREMRLVALTPEGEALGLTLGEVARQLRQGFFGEEVQRLQRGRDEVKVMVRYPIDGRRSLGDLDEARIRLPDGTEVPLQLVAESESGRGFSTIQRADRRRSVRITADIDKSVPGANANEIIPAFTSEVLEPIRMTFPGVTWTYQGEQKDQRQAMTELSQFGLLALFGIYILLAIPLRSYLQPVIVMCVIPFGVVGAVLGHVALGLELSIMSMCGIIALAGMVVNSSLILVDYVNRARAGGMDLHDAALAAGKARFRPVFLTTITTSAGLAPMVFETDLQARFLLPMAVSIASGVAFATLITLFLVPCAYMVLEDLRTILLKPEKAKEAELAFRHAHAHDSNRYQIDAEWTPEKDWSEPSPDGQSGPTSG